MKRETETNRFFATSMLLLVAVIGHAAVEVHSVASTAQILIITPDGKLLMKGQASGESYLQTDPTYFAESQFDKILRKSVK